jgi:hypothetical protein
MPPLGKTTLEVVIERIEWIKSSVDALVKNHYDLREEIKEDLVNVGDLETLRANYIAADEREFKAREKDIKDLKEAINELKILVEAFNSEYVSWFMMKWMFAVGFLILAIVLGVNRDMILTWLAKRFIP